MSDNNSQQEIETAMATVFGAKGPHFLDQRTTSLSKEEVALRKSFSRDRGVGQYTDREVMECAQSHVSYKWVKTPYFRFNDRQKWLYSEAYDLTRKLGLAN